MSGKVLYGVKMAVATPLVEATQLPEEGKAITFKTAEEVGIEKVVSEGSEEVKRVDDEILAVVTTQDIGYGYNLSLVDNVFQLDFLALLEGGTIRYDSSEPRKVVGYDDPMMSGGATTSRFQLELYIPSYAGTDIESYVKLTFPNCIGTASKLEFKKEFASPEFSIKAREASKIKKPSRLIDIVAPDELPSEVAQAIAKQEEQAKLLAAKASTEDKKSAK